MTTSTQFICRAIAAIWCVCLLPTFLSGQTPKLGDVSDGNRSVPVHLIDLYDEEGTVIRPDDEPMLPFSTRQTCNPCHNYNKISSGWHFNATRDSISHGRPGQPWILADPSSLTQLPLSYRGWPGTYRPEQIGWEPIEFVQAFGRHMPGGGIGEDEKLAAPEQTMRWWVSGKLEINCLSCHDAEAGHDQAEYANSTRRQNYRWAAAASSAFATVKGSARDMPDNYSIYGSLLDDARKISPSVTYDKSRFNDRGKVLFNMVREVPNERCYFCHSSKNVGGDREPRWTVDKDVHIAAGMKCVDCHRNGLNHNMVRGYEGEAKEAGNKHAAGFSCAGCHLENGSGGVPVAGRLGAPVPKHGGMPIIHFEKLTCTACHSGPWPKKETIGVKTSRGHGLGMHGVNKSDGSLPHIASPVFIRQADGKIAPHRVLWPAFWARLDSGKVVPMEFKRVREITLKIIEKDTSGTGNWPRLTSAQIDTILRTLTNQDSGRTKFGYISGGKLYRQNGTGGLIGQSHAAAKPYSWAFGHDVRPAAQSLGVRGCSDCHATDAPFYFSEVTIDSPISDNKKEMVYFLDLNGVFAKIFAASFRLRPWLKIIALVSSLVLASVLVLYFFRGLSTILRASKE